MVRIVENVVPTTTLDSRYSNPDDLDALTPQHFNTTTIRQPDYSIDHFTIPGLGWEVGLGLGPGRS